MDVHGMPSQSCTAKRVGVMKSSTEQDVAGLGYFATEQLGKRTVIGYYSGTQMYTMLYGDRDVEKRYGKGVMSMSVKETLTYNMHIFDDTKDSNPKSTHAWIEPDKFISLDQINDPQYLEEYRTLRMVQEASGREANI